MVALVSIETVLIVLLVILVAALLRSHAEILRRLGPEEEGRSEPRGLAQARSRHLTPAPGRGLEAPPAGDRQDVHAPELAGTTPTGDAVKLAFDGGPTLLAFLSSGCTSCAGFWETLGQRRIPAVPDTVIVTRGSDREQRAKLRSLAPATVPVVMSSQAWEDYAVPGSPYFVLVERAAIRGEGVATTWDALTSLVTDAVEEQRGVDERLAAAGIGPNHPSLFAGEGV